MLRIFFISLFHISYFDIEKIEEFWEKIKEYVDVETELGKTSWGSYKFVIRDPDGNRLGFAEKK